MCMLSIFKSGSIPTLEGTDSHEAQHVMQAQVQIRVHSAQLLRGLLFWRRYYIEKHLSAKRLTWRRDVVRIVFWAF